MRTTTLGSLLALPLLLAGCDPATDTTPDDQAPEDQAPYDLETIELPGDLLFPEGIAVDDDGSFYVGSLFDGSILVLRSGEREVEVLVPTAELTERAIGSAVGLLVDESSELVWVCDGGGLMGERPTAIVGIDIDDGSVAVRHPFPGGPGLCNDLTQDDEGNLYATDSLGPRIVAVAAADRRRDDSASDWATDPQWAVEPGQFGLNGLDVADDQLFVAHTDASAVFRVQIEADGSAGAITPIELDRRPNGLDGLAIAGDGSLVFVEGYADQLTRIALGEGDVGTLSVLDDTLDGPTTFAFFHDSAWIVEGQLPHLFDPMAGPPSLPFRIVRLRLDESLMP